ncbi:glycosyltransferase domain-containing protein [Kiloniella sp.]|uniref:glycosyltransferase domain-containing protein n=1 Tax=Kiloniella sp. TaxID=1938587 RepID=UPI003A94B867
MNTSKKNVIYTTIVGGYDNLIEQPKYAGWDYVCFTDQKSLGWRTKLGLSNWKIIPFENPGIDNTRYSRMPKLLPHRFLSEYEYSVYIDGNARLINNPTKLLDELSWPDFGAAYHPFRDNIYDEFTECSALGMDLASTFEKQKNFYLDQGLPNPSQLIENNFLLRRHNQSNISDLHEQWWTELLQHSKRDQLSLPYVSWKKNLWPTLMSQDLKHNYFRKKAHYRSFLQRLTNSIKKRLD